METVLNKLRSVLCDPEGKCCISGSDEDRAIVDEALAALSTLPPQAGQKPVGYMNAGHVHELQQKRAPYGYVYPDEATGAHVAVYTSPQPEQVAQETPFQEDPFTQGYTLGLAHNASQHGDDTELLDWLKRECCDLRCISVPTGGDDHDVRWVVIEHHMAAPHEREIGESFTDDPRDAIRAALARGEGKSS